MIRVSLNTHAYPRLRECAEALKITDGDMAGPVLNKMGQLHRKQQSDIFSTQGAAGAAGKWQALSSRYARQKAAGGRASTRKLSGKIPANLLGKGFTIFSARAALGFSGRGKILVLTGDTRRRFTKATAPEYVQQFVPAGGGRGVFRFGAMSDVAAAHLHGNPALAPHRSYAARKVFGGDAPNLPVRDMVTKTEAQRQEFIPVFVTWYTARVKQVLRAFQRLFNAENRGVRP